MRWHQYEMQNVAMTAGKYTTVKKSAVLHAGVQAACCIPRNSILCHVLPLGLKPHPERAFSGFSPRAEPR